MLNQVCTGSDAPRWILTVGACRERRSAFRQAMGVVFGTMHIYRVPDTGWHWATQVHKTCLNLNKTS